MHGMNHMEEKEIVVTSEQIANTQEWLTNKEQKKIFIIAEAYQLST